MANNWGVAKRLALGFGLTVAVGVAIAIYASSTMKSMSDGMSELATNRMVKVAQFMEVKDNFQSIGRFARNIVINNDPAFVEGEKKKIAALRAKNSELLAQLDKTLTLPKARELYQVIVQNRGPYNAALDRAIDMAVKDDKTGAGAYLNQEVRALQEVVFKATDDSLDLQQDIANKLANKAVDTAQFSLVLMAGLALGMAVFGAAVCWLLTRSLRKTLGTEPAALSEAISRVADGDLSQPLVLQASDSDSVLASLARMQSSLSGVVSRVRAGSESVATASAQIAQGNNDLSARTEQQASSLEETAASMEELGSTVKQNADSARQANQLAMNASTVAVQGGEVVGQVVQTMKGINESSRKIADIISVIDGIAFQTNILALNAAVEAARAGEQGRGFAVVASEVRSLAGRSGEAAKEIKTLINASVERVEQGTLLVDKAGETMTEVVSSIRRVTDIMGEISAASSEQSAGVSQVGEAVSQMDQVTQQNAALVEEMAAAASSLKSQANDLVQVVAVFKLGNESPGSHAATSSHSLSAGGSQALAAPLPPASIRSSQPRRLDFAGAERRAAKGAALPKAPAAQLAANPVATPVATSATLASPAKHLPAQHVPVFTAQSAALPKARSQVTAGGEDDWGAF